MKQSEVNKILNKTKKTKWFYKHYQEHVRVNWINSVCYSAFDYRTKKWYSIKDAINTPSKWRWWDRWLWYTKYWKENCTNGISYNWFVVRIRWWMSMKEAATKKTRKR